MYNGTATLSLPYVADSKLNIKIPLFKLKLRCINQESPFRDSFNQSQTQHFIQKAVFRLFFFVLLSLFICHCSYVFTLCSLFLCLYSLFLCLYSLFFVLMSLLFVLLSWFLILGSWLFCLYSLLFVLCSFVFTLCSFVFTLLTTKKALHK